ncbi:hypothetical protein [Lysinibacillus antri]|uniref:Uncharacterized protein n=1 Tax=Lysinibacillus antri TaxID=2498145 RepID=A0A3S0WIE0_9BACI|nr:hypothetical protein [Lysinibacillus antri]RUL56443.1 hypothetical protein EK386_02085 [Lysinibacillus antri]
MKEEGERKIRSDKKVDVKPTLSIELKNSLYTFSYLCNEPVKDVAEKLCLDGAVSKVVIDDICKWFRRSYQYNNVIAVGDADRPKLKINYSSQTSKVTIRFKREDYDLICNLAHALDLTPTSTAALLIRVSLRNIEFMQQYCTKHLMDLSNERKKKIDVFLNELWGLIKK